MLSFITKWISMKICWKFQVRAPKWYCAQASPCAAASWYKTAAFFIFWRNLGDKVDHEKLPRLTWRSTWVYSRWACSHSFLGPGGKGLLHSGHSCLRPRSRRASIQVLQNSWLHGSVIGRSGDSRQIAHVTISALSARLSDFSPAMLVVFANRSLWACSAADWSNAWHSCLCPPPFQCSTWHSLEQYHLTLQPPHRIFAFLDSHKAHKLTTSLPFFFFSVFFPFMKICWPEFVLF